ncbi:MAG: tRNA (adenosine(37)-N6)-dimethylallyltransferase MiaA [Candidatus Gracilibacteria bacterium]|nr:tRNA (adenosine(37)-N6)-dimethylallyltransferase MiaA [Candidatus Gracilibacteria bacterium]
MPKIIIVYGPTASGKTGLAIEIAKRLRTEVIGADSRQIYRFLDIGTGKVTPEEMDGVPHHLIDIRNPDEKYSVGEYQREATSIIEDILQKGQVPILCGGTGLYLDAVAFHFDLPPMAPDWGYRDRMETLRLQHGNEYLWNMLDQIDSEYATSIHPNSHHAVIRALEVFEKTGQSKQVLRKKKEPLYDILFFTPYDGDRAKLYNRINNRIEEMFTQGLVEEVQSILARGYTPESFGLNTIGYKETIEMLEGKIDLETCKDRVKQGNRNYAKRQLTWFRKYNETTEI